MIKLSALTVALAAMLTAVAVQAAPSVINGGFETADLTGWGGTATSDGYGYNPFGTIYGVGMEGTHWMWLAGYEVDRTLSQTVTGLTAGESYRISFLMSSENTHADELNLSVDGGAATLFSTVADTGGFWNVWTEKTYDFVAGSSTATILFSSVGLNKAGYDVGLDNVRVAALSVPEPTSALLAGVALLGAGAASRRRTR